ncbi:MAG: SOS response-associated peptidase family protein [Sphingomonas sp.]|uniref:SOS response-associated peptidase family protein n=1 Tax=Sphingomonas sp. TaxID=28214 RepID=UPI001ACD8FE9|nr:SOS response-associated peptidase family protein [Sphingomonas sp.]MBN8808413.1 SOS response-associated peptidase family protein [Sphingomonas sp.]
MSVIRIRAIIMALAALDRTRDAAAHQSMTASPDLRALLALLASLGDGDPRPYGAFIHALELMRTSSSSNNNDVGRSNDLSAARIGILRDLGIDDDTALLDEIGAIRDNGRIAIERGICTHIALDRDLPALFRRFAIEQLRSENTAPLTGVSTRGIAWIVNKLGMLRQLEPAVWGFERRLSGRRGGPVQNAITNVSTAWGRHWLPTCNQFSRCLVPFQSFAVAGGRDAQGGRQTHWFEFASNEPASFAGVYRSNGDHRAFAILTTEPNAAFAAIGVKAMPVILLPEDEARWLDKMQRYDVFNLVAALPSQLLRQVDPISRPGI